MKPQEPRLIEHLDDLPWQEALCWALAGAALAGMAFWAIWGPIG